ncbi:DNA-binding XRE family transcriptional regulator [Salinibacter ruber]|uniref:helix-turn-helix domain-containing protein n=1 Tax=Salinibacter ruber TaxID=146919 RepID=UPI00216707F9|nr:helix-turn-helix transcriptional regulator [Salinibacter ruber]MCS3862713.1 DNA-binding XRE family transcriptional regulator [Salinibacter ruber]
MTDAPPDEGHDVPSMTPADLAERARELREDAGLTQRDLADKIECSISTISKAENFREGDGMISARITIIETLTDERVEGPLYR